MKDFTPLYDRAKADVDAEIVSQLKKWGFQHHAPEFWLVILTEEVGEVAQAILGAEMNGFRQELVQVAAVCLSAIAALDDEKS